MSLELLTLLVTLLGVGGLVSLVTALREKRQRQDADRESFTLTFPVETTPQQVVAVLRSMSGLAKDRPWSARSVVVEALGLPTGIKHRLHVPKQWVEPVRSRLLVELPGLGLEPLPDDAVRPDYRRGLESGLSDESGLLRTDAPELVSRSLLTALQPVREDEAVLLQWVIAPVGPGPRPSKSRTHKAGDSVLGALAKHALNQKTAEPEPVPLPVQRAKLAEPLYLASVRVVAAASTGERASHLVKRLRSALAVAETAGGLLKPRMMSQARVAKRASARQTPGWWSALLNAAELTPVLGWPLGRPNVPGLNVRRSRWFAPAPELERTGRVLGDGLAAGELRPVAQSLTQAKTHTWVTGKTGAGKSTLLANMMLQDIASPAKPAVILIEPKGDLVGDVLRRIPEHRRQDVIVLDPARDVLVGLNPLRLDEPDRELVADEVYGVFNKLSTSWGPRLGDVLYNALQTLARQPDAALTELPLLLGDDGYRRQAVARLGEDGWVLRSFWAQFESLTPAERATIAAPILTRVRPWITRTNLRHLVGVPSPRWTFRDVLNDGKILLVSLNTGLLGQETVNLLGSLIFQSIWQAATSRATIPQEKRRTALLYADEWQDYTHLPTSIDNMLSQARGYGLGLVFANQTVTQLSPGLLAAVTAHARSKLVMASGHADAVYMAREIGGVTVEDVQGLGAREAIASLMAGDQTAPPVSIRTRPLAEALMRNEDEMLAVIRHGYGLDPAEVEQAIRQRHEPQAAQPTSNRRRRSS
ncbi:type IV secretory system conjugative DNA transfer family protein [Actinosynnema sp. NPDC023794]